MKAIIIILICWLCCLESFTQKFKTQIDTFSYCIGLNIADNLREKGIKEVNTKFLVKAFDDIYSENISEISIEEADSIVNEYFNKLQNMVANENLEKGKLFLEENKNKEGVIVLESGLQYKVIVMGEGSKPSITDNVLCHYKGTLIDGKVFDSSYDRGEPISFPLQGVISGWTEALQLMPVGSKWMLFIPPHLAYGDRGAGAVIGPNETLIFEVELLSIN